MLVAFIATILPLAVGGADYSDLRGSYCSSRPYGCCPGRQDDCSTPILGTLCYCDDFCNRTRNEDCCPDFWGHCKGVRVPLELVSASCYHNGKSYDYGQITKINCNECKCQTIGGQMEFLCESDSCLVDTEMISDINNQRSLGWHAGNISTFWGHKLEEGVIYRLGTLLPHKAVLRMNPLFRVYDKSRLPGMFDSRNHWPGWIQGIEDQGWCGSSWAISSAAVASDRFIVMSKGYEKVKLAPQHLLSCNNRGQMGCSGGHLDRAWLFMRKFGLVDENCYPYASQNGDTGRCRIPKRGNLLTARCSPQQIASFPPRKDMYKMGPAYRIGSEEDIMYEIMHSGPVQATIKVYPDFFVYRGGIYKQSGLGITQRTGYHSVRIIGWGEERGVKYWLVANSWGPHWGENGYFRIIRGKNECDIEKFVVAAWAHNARTVTRIMNNQDANTLSNII